MTALQIVALVLAVGATVAGVGIFARGVAAIVATVRRGGPAPDRTTEPWRRTRLVVAEVLGHQRFAARPLVRVAHWVVMLAFPVLSVTLISGYGQILDPRFALHGIYHWVPLEWLVEGFGWAGLLGIAWLVAVRQRERRRPGRASRFFGSNAGQASFVEAVIGVVVAAALALRALEYALAAQSTTTSHLASGLHFPLTAWLGTHLVDVDTAVLENTIVVLALVKVLVSMTWMVVVGLQPAMGVSWHRFLAVVNVWARRELDGTPALGPLPPVRAAGAPVDFDALEDLPDGARLGVGRIEDFTWKGLLDFSTCTECGRCQEQCPAWNTGKPLSPKLIVLALRDHAFATAPVTSAADPHAGLDVLSLVGDVVDPEALWDCTTCGACVQQCPVDIEHIDHIVDMRRHEVLMNGAFPAPLAKVFAGLERQGNPWGLPARKRMDWAKDLDFPVPVVGADVDDAADLDYLFWVGCAGSYDDNARRTTRAVAELLHTAGVRFAVLGDAEGCSGDPARRAGNELLFQMIARSTIDTLTEVRATRIVVTCPHCLNTLGREYPELGGRFEVVHHTELLDALVAEGRLTPVPPADDAGTLTYHDPCYLGRHNGIYTPPRELLTAAGATVTEMPRSGETSFCCGGGGARVWLEETAGTRINVDRAAEAPATGADRVATGCPFCVVMLTNGMGAAQADAGRRIEVVDVAQVLLEAVRPPA